MNKTKEVTETKPLFLIVNNGPQGETEFTQPFLEILTEAKYDAQVIEYSDLPQKENEILAGKTYAGIILSGSPRGNDIAHHHQSYFGWIKNCRTPILGVCAGHHIIGIMYGAELLRSKEIEVGDFYIFQDQQSEPLFDSMPEKILVKQNHMDSITLPQDFILLAHSERCKVEAIRHKNLPIYTLQFHPEILNEEIVLNFAELAISDNKN